MKTSDFNASLKFCASEKELRFHHAAKILAGLKILAEEVASGETPWIELVESIRDVTHEFHNTSRLQLLEREAELTANG